MLRIKMTSFLAGIIALSVASPATAWKPTTHVYLAGIAYQDAVADGKVTIPLLDGTSVTYKLDAATLKALKSGRGQYHAGVLGPDAYPDIATGQQVIHPSKKDTGIPGGSSAWLQHVWNGFGTSDANRAFRLGFLTHAAGDMYGHTFINYFSGGPFTFNPTDNAVKHVLLEGYIDKRLPAAELTNDFWQATIKGVNSTIYKQMVDASGNKALRTRLLRAGRSSTKFSVPSIFSALKDRLKNDVKRYDNKLAEFDRKIKNCKLTDFSCSKVVLTGKRTAYVAANGIQSEYKRRWIEDITRGLKAWPETSHKVAKALFFNPERKTDTAKAEKILTDYAQVHLLSMAGAPDFVGLASKAIGDIIEKITPDFLLAPIRELKRNMLNAMLKASIGMTKDELKKYLTQPDRYFDQVMTRGQGTRVTLATFNRDYLKISDPGYQNPKESFDYKNIPAAYNTVMMSKLIYLSQAQINDLLVRLGAPKNVTEKTQNVMLGYIGTLDGSNQWRSGIKMVFARDCGVYAKLFMKLPGGAFC